MDSLSELVQLMAPSGTVDLHCRVGAGWSTSHPKAPQGHVPYHVILDGEARVRSGKTGLRVQAGDVLLFPHGAAHILRTLEGGPGNASAHAPDVRTHFNGLVTEITAPDREERLDMLCGTFLLRASAGVLLRTLPDVLCIGTAQREDCAWLRGLIGMMREEAQRPQPGGIAIIAELSTALFTVLLRTLMAEGGVARGLLALMSDTRLARAVDAVVQAPEQPWTVERLADLCNVSRATLARRFTQLGGMTPLELVTALRMERAAHLLGQGQLSAAAVGEQCGYGSQAAFGRAFRQYFGVGPGAFRRETRERRESTAQA